MRGRLDDQGVPPERSSHLVDAKDEVREVAFPREIAGFLDLSADAPRDLLWDSFLDSFGDLLLKTASYSHRRKSSASDSNDATMDA